MHPSLDIRRLNQLSSAVRRAAQAMICENPSADTISTFITAACTGPEARNQIRLLPVFYHCLDTRRIPTPDALDTCTVDTTNLLRAGITSLLLICEIPSRLPAVSDLWPRVWAWIQFGHMYGEILRQRLEIGLLPEAKFHCALTNLCENMTTDRSNESLMFGTPGFAAFTARSWAVLSQSDYVPEHERVIIILDNIFSGGTGFLDDLLDAVDGNVTDLAQLFRRELDFAIGTSSLGKPWLLSGILNMVSHSDDKTEGNNFGVRSPTPLYSALVPLNFVGPLTLIVSKLTQPNELIPHVKQILRHAIPVLEMCFRGPRRDQTLRVAIQSGLLPVMRICGQLQSKIHQTLRYLITKVLTPSVVYHDVIPDLVTAYSSASVGLQQREFFDPAVYDDWMTLGEVLIARSQCLIDFEAADRVYRRACDNMKCGMISDRTNLKRCAGCRELLYCSRACQISDWQTGHRESCRFHFAYHKKIRASYTAKEHAFLRFLFHRDAVKSMPSLVPKYLHALAQNPNTKFATVYDYRIHPPVARVVTLEHLAVNGIPEHWADLISRVRRSEGRMSLDLMGLVEGENKWAVVFPYRWETSDIEQALKGFASGTGSLSAQQEEAMGNLLAGEGSAGIH
ncbi:hypothetical protein R3P38DRAFT_2647040 [Favolaschia claudopus]|uniref:MYND-type domain-containing protein n=1 Tax=Favolaschia claudopus TaxID=2862362 RepID=A0AAW0ABK1_9AGAR